MFAESSPPFPETQFSLSRTCQKTNQPEQFFKYASPDNVCHATVIGWEIRSKNLNSLAMFAGQVRRQRSHVRSPSRRVSQRRIWTSIRDGDKKMYIMC